MKLDSFRYKISLLSLVLSGIVLVVFGLFFMSVINRIGCERIDRELRILADAQVRRGQPPEHWQRFEDSLRSVYGENEARQFVVKIVPVRGRGRYISSHWPAELKDSSLPVLAPPSFERDDAMSERPPMPPRRMRPPDAGPPEGIRPFDEDPIRRGGPPPRMIVRGPVFDNISLGKKSWRIVAIGNAEINLYIGMDLEVFHAEINRFRNAFLVGMPVALVLLAFGGWLIAHRALRPVNVIAATTANVTTKGLNLRIPRTGADREFAGLIDVINGMLDRLEKSFQQATRFSGDAAHELKTPLTILQGQLEEALQEAPAGSEVQQRYSGLLEEVRRLAAITRKLLLLSQADSGQMKLSLVPFNLSSALESMAEDVVILASNLKLRKNIRPGVNVMADKDLITQALQNLVTNAIKYNEKGGWIKFELDVQDKTAIFGISNSGEEIPWADRGRIFDRFYRVSKSRNRDIDGIGLGLSLAREIVIAHKGELFLVNSSNDATTFAMKLAVILS
ncbi:MAG: ATP-binding protein [Kiritimatiellae bacterium]|nr:ATP-binding protein [Kiritimatiellia bacterium]